MFLRAVTVVVAVAGLAAAQGAAQSRPDVNQESPYAGGALEGSVFVCSGDAQAAEGFRTDPKTGKVVQSSEVTRPKRGPVWQVRLAAARADVVPIAGSGAGMEAAGDFSVSRGESALLLSLREGTGSAAITIDLRNSSFVYSIHKVTATANRVEVFSGSCRPYV